ncbi:hypothetical protein DL89DRAFT_37027 [Linderina pennispora]|uniref:Uncharacterized protein n=1 Tax=Linderina pennispora TaxID=61395 RepID=A0A1Y1W3G3_9FUNG|nr:uncharacterized protein DL89DRAFT_37027 [Linderina pennispora]ORX67835.1 hypothetical protein DL89DRAFT_37027 [Linderina pennispora]
MIVPSGIHSTCRVRILGIGGLTGNSSGEHASGMGGQNPGMREGSWPDWVERGSRDLPSYALMRTQHLSPSQHRLVARITPCTRARQSTSAPSVSSKHGTCRVEAEGPCGGGDDPHIRLLACAHPPIFPSEAVRAINLHLFYPLGESQRQLPRLADKRGLERC